MSKNLTEYFFFSTKELTFPLYYNQNKISTSWKKTPNHSQFGSEVEILTDKICWNLLNPYTWQDMTVFFCLHWNSDKSQTNQLVLQTDVCTVIQHEQLHVLMLGNCFSHWTVYILIIALDHHTSYKRETVTLLFLIIVSLESKLMKHHVK